MPSDSELLHQILAGVQQSRGEVNRLETSITEMARSVSDLAKSAVRFEQNIEHLESRMEDEISRQRETMTELARDIQKLAQGVQALQVHQQQVDAEVRLLKKAQEDDQSSRQWLTRSIIDKLIWPALAVIAAAVAVLTNKEP